VKNQVEFLFFQTLLLFVKLLPTGLIPAVGKLLGMTFYYLGVRKKVVNQNLKIAFGEQLTDNERKRLSKQTYRHCGIVTFEILLLRFIPPEKLSNYIEIEGTEVLNDAIAEGRGVVLAGNHFGNWEMISAAISTQVAPIHIYAGMQRNDLFDKALNAIRQKFGTITISKSKTATIEMMKVLKNNQILGMAGDLNVPHNKFFIDFFGRKAAVGRGLASFTLSRECPLIFLWCVRTGPLKHKGFLSRVDYGVTGDKNSDLIEISQALANELELRIQENPDQYFWLNKRWKTRPDEEEGPGIY